MAFDNIYRPLAWNRYVSSSGFLGHIYDYRFCDSIDIWEWSWVNLGWVWVEERDVESLVSRWKELVGREIILMSEKIKWVGLIVWLSGVEWVGEWG